jgi:chorismate mutase/prephenate dehydratase
VEVAREAVSCPPDTPCKTSLVLILGHRPGLLGEILRILGERAVNLTKIESRPILGQPWRYRFYLDLEGHAASHNVAEALSEVAAQVVEMRVLGTYPRADDPNPIGGDTHPV